MRDSYANNKSTYYVDIQQMAQRIIVFHVVAYYYHARIMISIDHNTKFLKFQKQWSSKIHRHIIHRRYHSSIIRETQENSMHRESPISENSRNHSAFTIGRTFLSYFPEANYNKNQIIKGKKTIGMTID